MIVVIIGSTVLVLNIIFWILVLKKIKKEFSDDGVLPEIRQEIDKLITEINRETDHDITLIEAKCNEIRSLIDTAEKKIMLYTNTLVQKENEQKVLSQIYEYNSKNQNFPAKKAAKAYSSNKKNSATNTNYLPLFAENAGTKDIEDLKNNEKIFKSAGKSEAEYNNITNGSLLFTENTSNSIPKVSEAKEKIIPKVDLSQQIIQLANKGFSSDLIASKLNISISQVETTMDIFM